MKNKELFNRFSFKNIFIILFHKLLVPNKLKKVYWAFKKYCVTKKKKNYFDFNVKSRK